MTTFGYTLLGEEHDPRELVGIAQRVEEAGFDFVVASDHYHPWVPEQRHSPYAWSVLGAVATMTERVELGTMVTCPTVRYHPAVVAQKAATVSVMSGGRFTLGVGAGESLNEHVVGQGWPPVDIRHEMLEEAVEIFRLLWQGGFRRYRGQHFTVDDARVFDLPDGQIPVCWAEDPQAALLTIHERFRWATLGWKVMSELPNPVNFDRATSSVTPEGMAGKIPHGPDPEDHLRAIRQYTEAGFNRVALYQIGDDQEGFFRFWEQELRPRLAEVAPAHAVAAS